jgi:Tfp pilus assembly protein PilO
MEHDSKQQRVRIAGIYIILILALLRFLVYPLHGAVDEQKLVFTEQQEAYQLKKSMLARQAARPERKEKPLAETAALYSYLYEKEKPLSDIQVDILQLITDYAQKKGLTVLNFELLEAIAGKEFSEVPVLIRLTGKPDLLIDTLGMIGAQKRALNVKSVEITGSGQGLTLVLTVAAFRMEK